MSDNHDLLNDNDMYSFSGYEADYMCFNNDIAIYGYRNDVHSMTENVAELTEILEQGDTEHITEWLNEAISEGAALEEEERAKELLEKLAEYKPLAKIEEMEEQNYNMMDNVLKSNRYFKCRKQGKCYLYE